MNRFERVREICGGWCLYEEGNSTEQMQILKAISEAGELADSIAKNDREQAKDDIGDILVCLINAYRLSGSENNIEDKVVFNKSNITKIDAFSWLIDYLATGLRAKLYYARVADSLATIADYFNLQIEECLDQAISEIEKRKGKIINGVFVKDAT